MSQIILQTPEDAENAFYTAFEKGDLQSMMNIWLESEDVTCIHPGIPRLDGFDMVKEGWRHVLENRSFVHIQTTDVKKITNAYLSVHTVREEVKIGGKLLGSMLATNTYRKIKGCWKIISHHASPEPEIEYATNSPDIDDDVVFH